MWAVCFYGFMATFDVMYITNDILVKSNYLYNVSLERIDFFLNESSQNLAILLRYCVTATVISSNESKLCYDYT
jgi:hypothetical protein